MTIRISSCALALAALFVTGVVQAQTTIKIATIAPEGSSWMQEMRAGAKEIKARTNGRVTIKFYGGGVMGNDKKVLRKMRIGQLHGGAFTSGALTEFYPDVQVYGLPFLFDNYEEVDYVRARMDAKFAKELDKNGLVTFGLSEGGFALMMANEPIRGLEDLKNKKIWVPEGDQISYVTMKQFGLAPVTLPLTDVMTGLQTGLVDIIASSPVGALALQWHTRVKYVTNMPVSYIFATLAIDKKIFMRLSPGDQAIVREVMDRVYEGFDKQNRMSNEQAAHALAANNITFVDVYPAEAERFKPQAREIYSDIVAAGIISKAVVDEIEGHLDEFRAIKANMPAAEAMTVE